MTVPIDFGDDEFEGASEHPFVRRLRHRRLLAFLWLQGMGGTFGSMVHETDTFCSVVHLQDFMKQGRWRDAIAYLSRFVQPNDKRLLSLEAQVLHRFLLAHKHLADILSDTKEGRELADFFRKYHRHDSTVCHGTIRLRSIMLTVLHAKDHLRASFDWERVRGRAAKIAYKLVHRIPELKGVVTLPAGLMTPHNVLPIHTCTGQRFRRKKHPCQLRASALAKRYLQRRGRLLSSSHSKESDNDLYAKAANWVADILAGKPHELHQKRPLKTSGKQGALSNPISQGMFSTLTYARNSVTSSVIQAGATSAPVSQTMFGTMAGSARNPGMPSVASAGTHAGDLARSVLSPGDPFSKTTLGATVSQNKLC